MRTVGRMSGNSYLIQGDEATLAQVRLHTKCCKVDKNHAAVAHRDQT